MASISKKHHSKLKQPFTVVIPDTNETHQGAVNAYSVSFEGVLHDLRRISKLKDTAIQRMAEQN